MKNKVKTILDIFAARTGLEFDKDFVYTQNGGTGYCFITVYKDGRFLKLGEFSYRAWVSNVNNDLTKFHFIRIIEYFCDQCILRMNAPALPMPKTLCGNTYFVVQDYQDKVEIPQWLVTATRKYFKETK